MPSVINSDCMQAYGAFLDGMRKGSTSQFTALLAPGFTLTHITGYVQSKDEWLSQMAAGQFIYHSIEEVAAEENRQDITAHVNGRIVTDASIYGSRGRWRLNLAVDLVEQGGGWRVGRAIATTW